MGRGRLENEIDHYEPSSKKQLSVVLLVPVLLLWLQPAGAGVFEFADEEDEFDVISHPTGYRGRGGELEVTVGIAPTSPHATEMEISVQNAINTWNQLIPTIGNLKRDGSVPQRMFDFESVVLHEIGHCIGLGHPNLATESGVASGDRNYTNAFRGSNNQFDLDPGSDGVIGSADDERGDDVNRHWFNSANNPFILPEVIDQTTYSLELDDLPAGHQFAANGDRSVSFLLGFDNTEAVMQQGIESGESTRTLAADDVATLRLAMTGLDRIAGTSDDYTLTLQYAGMTNNADIVINFDNRASFAACSINGIFLNDKHIVIRAANISFNTGFAWFFNPELTPLAQQQPIPLASANGQDKLIALQSGERLTLTVGLEPEAKSGNQADYWVRAKTPVGDFWLNNRLQFIRSDIPIRVYGGPLVEFTDFKILDDNTTGFPAGVYTVTFAVDDNRDGFFDGTYQHSVSFTISSQ